MTLPRYTIRRRNPITCSSCGIKLERVLPAAPYYSLALVTGLLVEFAIPAVLFLSFFRQWAWIALIIVGVVAVNLAVSVFLNARTRVEYANIEDARRDKPGRWYPD